MGRSATEEVEHGIIVEATQVYRGEVVPDRAEFLTNDGERRDPLTGKAESRQGPVLEFNREEKRTYECKCGRRFRKPETARQHLEEVNDGR